MHALHELDIDALYTYCQSVCAVCGDGGGVLAMSDGGQRAPSALRIASKQHSKKKAKAQDKKVYNAHKSLAYASFVIHYFSIFSCKVRLSQNYQMSF